MTRTPKRHPSVTVRSINQDEALEIAAWLESLAIETVVETGISLPVSVREIAPKRRKK